MKLTNKHILSIIILIAIVLRFYHFFDIPFTHDELSAFLRTQYSNLSEVIEFGVKQTDTHPAGIQVFMYYWIRWFGTDIWIIKFPFTLMGVASVLLVFLIGKKWFNDTVGILSAAMLASTQYMVMYSQIARPYISGLFFSLFMVLFWTNLIKKPDKRFAVNAIGYVLFSAFCAYNHHFSLLFAAIVGITGLFIIPSNMRVKYILLGISIFILYIPHLPIFSHQLSQGGIEGWLGKPRPEFVPNYLFYIFNYSLLAVALTLSILLWGIFKRDANKFNFRFTIIAALWFVIPFAIGYFYSVYVNSVIQFSVLIFSHVFLYFLLWGHIKPLKPAINLLLSVLILVINSYSLIYQRKHYDVFYHSPYVEVLLNHQKLDTPKEQTLSIVDSDPDNLPYYMKKLQIDSTFVWLPSLTNEKELIELLEAQKPFKKYVYFGCLANSNPVNIPIILDYYPTLVWQKNFAGGTCYLFSKEPPQTKPWVAFFDFEQTGPSGFTTPEAQQLTDSISFLGKTSYFMDSTHEWSLNFSCQLNPIMKNENNFIDISLMTKIQDSFTDAVLVATIETVEGKQVYWGGASFQKFVPISPTPNTWIPVHHSIKLSDVPLVNDEMVLKTFVWNLKKQQFFIDDYGILVRDGNPVIYSLLEDFNK
ncbi:MAG: glycosyltransferase family 39 protein [Salinivirgaceae bacterium]|nr:glycosyltransferase family 39 protein [Salinivirgaceae bacterium]